MPVNHLFSWLCRQPPHALTLLHPQAYPCLFKGLSAKHLHMAVPPAQLWEADNKLHLCANNSSSFGFCSFCSITLVFKKNK